VIQWGMKRKPGAPVFKEYVMQQSQLLPASYDELIAEKQLVRVVNEAVEKIDLGSLLAQNKGGGTSSYHPKMLLKVLVYAYSQKIYSSRKPDLLLLELPYGQAEETQGVGQQNPDRQKHGSQPQAAHDDVLKSDHRPGARCKVTDQ